MAYLDNVRTKDVDETEGLDHSGDRSKQSEKWRGRRGDGDQGQAALEARLCIEKYFEERFFDIVSLRILLFLKNDGTTLHDLACGMTNGLSGRNGFVVVLLAKLLNHGVDHFGGEGANSCELQPLHHRGDQSNRGKEKDRIHPESTLADVSDECGLGFLHRDCTTQRRIESRLRIFPV